MTSTLPPANESREMAARSFASAEESFARCDTDGFLSQWASSMTGRMHQMNAEIAENGGMAEFPALFDADGNLLPAKWFHGRYGMQWGLLKDFSDTRAPFVAYFVPSRARDDAKRIANNLAKGYRLGRVKAPARARIVGSGTGLSGAASASVQVIRTDGGLAIDVEVVSIEGLS